MTRRTRNLRAFAAVALLPLSAGPLLAQAADVSAPEVRQKSVAAANLLLASREAPSPLPSPLPNPFVPKESLALASANALVNGSAEAPPSAADLLARLAARIPSTGTVFLGGQPILLVGQKRLRVGDIYVVAFEGQSYELIVTEISSTSFTLKRGDNLHTRPVRLSTSTPPRQ